MGRTRLVVGSSMVVLLMAASALPASAALPLKNPPCGSVIKASFKLRANKTCSGDAFKIGKSGITINLNGRKLSGDGGDGDFGIDNSRGFDNVTIRDGKITGFEDGILLKQDARNNVILRVHGFLNTSDGVDAEDARALVVRRSVFYSNSGDGVDIHGGRRHRIVRVRALGNGDDGLDVEANATSIVDNVLQLNADHGVELDGNGNVVTGNLACNNPGGNYALNGAYTFTDNTDEPLC